MSLLWKFTHLHERELFLDLKGETHCKAQAYTFLVQYPPFSVCKHTMIINAQNAFWSKPRRNFCRAILHISLCKPNNNRRFEAKKGGLLLMLSRLKGHCCLHSVMVTVVWIITAQCKSSCPRPVQKAPFTESHTGDF